LHEPDVLNQDLIEGGCAESTTHGAAEIILLMRRM